LFLAGSVVLAQPALAKESRILIPITKLQFCRYVPIIVAFPEVPCLANPQALKKYAYALGKSGSSLG
jgi:hypothetical protein